MTFTSQPATTATLPNSKRRYNSDRIYPPVAAPKPRRDAEDLGKLQRAALYGTDEEEDHGR